MRLTTHVRFVNITVNTSTIQGYVYEDNNNNSTYEPGIDTPLSGVRIQVKDEFRPEVGTFNLTTDAQGHCIRSGLFPSKYNISAIQNGFTLSSSSVIVKPDNNSYNISKPKLAGVTGKVYYDTNKNSKVDANEGIGPARIDLLYTNLAGQKVLVNTFTTDTSGSYSFSALVPGSYSLNATIRNTTTGYLDYATTQSITLTANKTLSQNVSITFFPIAVSGHTTYQSTPISSISLVFAPDASVVNNTALQSTTSSATDGSYAIKLMPGQYNITATKTVGSTPVYAFTGQLTVLKGEGTATYNIALVKQSVTVTGTTSYNGVAKQTSRSISVDDLMLIITQRSTQQQNQQLLEPTP